MCHVLIIEDEPIIAADIESILQRCGGTSFSFADNEADAVVEARRHRPGFITADVNLLIGTGPRAVAAIASEHGYIPTIFITGTPEDCVPCDPPHRVHQKPVNEARLTSAFHEMWS